jgi:hypothetical protein
VCLTIPSRGADAPALLDHSCAPPRLATLGCRPLGRTHYLAHLTSTDRIHCPRRDRLQQEIACARNRVSRRVDLSLPGGSRPGLPRVNSLRIESAFLQSQGPRQISLSTCKTTPRPMKISTGGRRQILVLTPEEKKAVACIVAAFILGLATMHYRATHPRTPPQTAREQYAAQRTAKAAAARARSARGRAPASGAKVVSRVTPAPSPAQEETDED